MNRKWAIAVVTILIMVMILGLRVYQVQTHHGAAHPKGIVVGVEGYRVTIISFRGIERPHTVNEHHIGEVVTVLLPGVEGGCAHVLKGVLP